MNNAKSKPDLDLSDFESFLASQWTSEIINPQYDKDAKAATEAVATLISDLKELNNDYVVETGRTLFTTLDGRVKNKESFAKKLYSHCREECKTAGLDENNLNLWYSSIHDLAGVRFSCPYFDEVQTVIRDRIRPFLQTRAYAIELSTAGLRDSDYMDKGNDYG